jgi:hypothetical protein
MSPRERLPNRRLAETLELEVGGLHYKLTIGFFPDGAPGEVFLSNHKAGNASDVAARDAGILISLLLQHDCEIETISRAISRNSDGSPSGVVGAALDLLLARAPWRRS